VKTAPARLNRRRETAYRFQSARPSGRPHPSVEEPLDGFQEGVEERLPLRVQDPVQICAHRPGDQQEKSHEKRKLQPSVEIHGRASSLEFLGSDDRDEQVPDQQEADDADDETPAWDHIPSRECANRAHNPNRTMTIPR